MIMTAQLMALGDILLRPVGISQLLVLLKMYSGPGTLLPRMLVGISNTLQIKRRGAVCFNKSYLQGFDVIRTSCFLMTSQFRAILIYAQDKYSTLDVIHSEQTEIFHNIVEYSVS